MGSRQTPRKYQRRKGDSVLFWEWRFLFTRHFHNLLLSPTAPEKPPPGIDPWTADLSALDGSNVFLLLPAIAAQEVMLNRALIEAKPAYSLLALQLLHTCEVSPPDWLRRVFGDAVQALAAHDQGSIDAAFAFRPPASPKVNLEKDRRNLAATALMYVISELKNGAKLEPELFAVVGEKLGVGKDKARDLAMFAQATFHGGGSLARWRDPVDWNESPDLTDRKSAR